ncbi:MAG: NUDIX hydrolase [Eubacterium sp.]|nr:NUDIX hydrolase [Eubacterium sp.]
MNPDYIFNVRVTGVLIENNKILIVKQKLSESREWSLPGGRLERGETLEQGLKREFKEETGLDVQIERLLYLCDVNASGNTVLHITFLITRTGGKLTLPTNEHDANPIHDVKFVSVDELTDYGFSDEFADLIKRGFPNRGNYLGDKQNIGLGI